MHLGNLIVNWLLIPLVAGGLGVAAMELAMWLMTSHGLAKGNMNTALGGLLTRSRSRPKAFRLGLTYHLMAGFGFALLYSWGLRSFGLTHFPVVLAASTGFGIFHGLVVSLLLVWIVDEHHPLEEFHDADLAIGLGTFVGHLAYGLAVGLVVGLASF